MKHIEDLQSLTFYKEKLLLPHNKNDKNKGYMFYSINSSLNSLDELLNNNHPIVSNMGHIYKAYYYDYTVLPKSIKSPIVKQTGLRINDAKKDRLAKYELIKTQIDWVRTPLVLRPNKNLNMVYDLDPVVELYNKQSKLEKQTLIKQLDSFFDTIYSIVSKNLSSYNTNPVIIVNLDEYNDCKNKRSHILYNILTLMRRSPKIIERFKKYNMNVLFYTKTGYFTVNTSTDISREKLAVFNRLYKRLKPNITVDDDVDTVEKEQVQMELIKQAMTNNLVGKTELPENIDPNDILDKDSDVVDTVKKTVKNVDQLSEDSDDKTSEIDGDLLKDDKFKEEYARAMRQKQTGGKSSASLKRDELLREKQSSIVIKTKTIGELTKEKSIPPIKKYTVKNDSITNEHLKDMKFNNFDTTYMDTLFEKDVANTIACLTEKSIPVNVLSVKVEDTSDTLTYKETYTVTLEDSNRKRHNLKFNLPKVVDDRFIYVNGSKKTIQNQFFSLPVVKIGPDSVQISTNYNKIIMQRFGAKLNANFDKFRKLIENGHIKDIHKGQNSESNKSYLTVLEYDQLAMLYTKISFGESTYVFNVDLLKEELGDKYKEATLTDIIVGYKTKTKEPIVYKQNGDIDLISFIVKESNDEEIMKAYSSFSTGKKFIYTVGTIMAKKMPMVLLACYFEGLSTVIRKFNDPSIIFTDKKSQDSANYNYIRFADGYLKYPIGHMAANIFFNGLSTVNTQAVTISSMDERSTYLDLFTELYGSTGIGMADALLNYYDFMIDPITLEILQTMDYPTDIVSLIIFANNLLSDNQYTTDIDLHNYRLRRLETISAVLYKNLSKAYTRFRRTANNPNPAKISIDENAVIKDIVALPTVEDYSELSPMVELHKQGTASMKGYAGMNMDRAYKEDKRAYHDSMIGVIGMSTDPGPNGGKIRQLAAEPTIINARGFFELNNRENPNALTDANLMTPIELLTPMTATHDDNNRNAMASKQTCHAVPVEGNCPALVSTGMDQMVHYRTSDSFSVVAKEDGKVIELNEEKELMIVQYKSGKKKAIDLSSHIVKNGGGGFYLNNKLTPRYKQGQSFKQDEILAYDKHYYKDMGPLGNRLTMGSLIKVVVASNYATYEDSTFITKNMSENLATNISMPHSIILGNNANVDYMVNVGDEVVIGDDLIRFESSYDDSELNRLLANVRDDLKEQIVTLGKSQVHSHYTGVVSDIQIDCTVPLDELSPSLKKIVKKYQDDIKSRKAILNKHEPESKDSVYRMGISFTKNDGITKTDEYGKVKGRDVGKGVLIEFYVTYHDELSDGDKLSQFTANKNTIGFQVPRGYEPYSEFRPYEEISGPVAPSAVLQRGTPSVIMTGCASKVLIELKRAQYKILTGQDYDEVIKQKQPYMVTDKSPVKEDISYDREITKEEISIMEDVYDLYKDSFGCYRSERAYKDGSVILPITDDVDMNKMISSFNIVEENHNAILNGDTIIAIQNILPNDTINVKL